MEVPREMDREEAETKEKREREGYSLSEERSGRVTEKIDRGEVR